MSCLDTRAGFRYIGQILWRIYSIKGVNKTRTVFHKHTMSAGVFHSPQAISIFSLSVSLNDFLKVLNE